MRLSRHSIAIAAALTLSAISGFAKAEPQANGGVTLGGAGVGYGGEFWDHAEFHLGLRGDVLFLREDYDDLGIGPYAEVGTLAFDELQVGAGASVLVPIHRTLPVVLSGGGYARIEDDGFGVEPGLVASLFWGSRSYNFHSNYVMAAGVLASYRQSLGASRESAFVLAAHMDLGLLATPFIGLLQVLRGASDEAKPIR